MVGGTSAFHCVIPNESRGRRMLRTKAKTLGRQSGAQDVQGIVCLDNADVVIDGMTKNKGLNGTLRLRSEFVTLLNLRVFGAHKCFVFSSAVRTKTIESQPLRAGYEVVP